MALLTMANREMLHRDAQCAADVGKMEAFGRFPTEFQVYGTAYQNADGEIYYRATEHEEKLYAYMQHKKYEGIYFTPIMSYRHYTKIFSEQKEQMLYDTKYTLLKEMKQQYEYGYFTLMQPFFSEPANDASAEILDQYRNEIEGYFDNTMLQNFEGFLEVAYESKTLKQTSYQKFKTWYETVCSQMSDEPIIDGTYKRTFYGFVYKMPDGTKKIFTDAGKQNAINKRNALLLKGYIVASIIQKSYCFQELQEIQFVREQCRQWIGAVQNEVYFQRLEKIRMRKGVIPSVALQQIKKQLMQYPEAYRSVCYYDVRWNKY